MKVSAPNQLGWFSGLPGLAIRVSDISQVKSNIRQSVHATQMQCTRSRSEIALGRRVLEDGQSGVEPFSRTQSSAVSSVVRCSVKWIGKPVPKQQGEVGLGIV